MISSTTAPRYGFCHFRSKGENKFAGKIFGIEPGYDGNCLIQTMIDKDAFGLKDWKLVESSEQGMLGEVGRAVKKN